MGPIKAAIFGFSGTSFTKEEKDFFIKHNPFGFIFFKRNCQTPEQVKNLTAELRTLLNRNDIPILIDQEGGRVARLRPPHWRNSPPCGIFAELAKTDVEAAKRCVYLNSRIIADELYNLGINVNCAPVADILYKDAHDIIGDRALGEDVTTVTELCLKMCEGLMDGGVMPIIKHIPGHGRADQDSHESLPVVKEGFDELMKTDFLVFRNLRNIPWGMTAHIKYTSIDNDEPATTSKKTINIIRNEIGFSGLLFTDDISMNMKALPLNFAERAVNSIKAGCDILLHCNGNMKEMEEVIANTPDLTEPLIRKIESERKLVKKPKNINISDLEKELASLINLPKKQYA